MSPRVDGGRGGRQPAWSSTSRCSSACFGADADEQALQTATRRREAPLAKPTNCADHTPEPVALGRLRRWPRRRRARDGVAVVPDRRAPVD